VPAEFGTRHRAGVPTPTHSTDFGANPYDTSFNCGGNSGLNSCATVSPSGITSAKYSPSFDSEKFACSRPFWRGVPELSAMTSKYPFAGMTDSGADGNTHFVRLFALSVRRHPARSTAEAPSLYNSIQSGSSPFGRVNDPPLSARNSLIRTAALENATAENNATVKNKPRISNS
jgi:hypothetical protein